MKEVQPGKEFTLVARIRDPFGNLTDPEKQEITVKDVHDNTVITITKPERIDVGIYRVTFKLPDDAEEGIWHIVWYTVIKGKEATSVTDINVKYEVIGIRALEINIPRELKVTFLGVKDYAST